MSYQNVEKAFIIPGMMWPRELLELHDLFRRSICHIEVGAFCGKSLYATACGMVDGFPNIKKQIISVDDLSSFPDVPSSDWVRSILASTLNEIDRVFGITVSMLEMSSEQAAFQLANCLASSIFIDADHSQEMVARDIMAWWPVLRNTGIMAGHDYCHEFPGVMNAVNEIFQGHHNLIEGTRIWYVTKHDVSNKHVELFKKRAVS